MNSEPADLHGRGSRLRARSASNNLGVGGAPRASRIRRAILDTIPQLVSPANTKFTVTEITNRAGVSRSAFYAEFANLDELALDVLRQTFDDIGAFDLELRRTRTISPADTTRFALVRLLTHMREYSTLYVGVLDLPGGGPAFTAAVDACAAHIKATIEALTNVPAGVNNATTARCIAVGVLTVASSWLEDGRTTSTNEVVDQLCALIPAWLANPPA